MQLLKNMHYKCATLYGLDTETNEMNSGKPSPESNVLRKTQPVLLKDSRIIALSPILAALLL